MAKRLRPTLGYLTRLTGRMQQKGWRRDDPAYAAAQKARDALHALTVQLHYLSLGPGHAGNPMPTDSPTEREAEGRGTRGRAKG